MSAVAHQPTLDPVYPEHPEHPEHPERAGRIGRAIPPPSGTVMELLDRAGASLLHASQAGEVGERYVLAHLAGLRTAAAVLAARTSPSTPSRPRSVWEVLPALAPELTEWAIFFAASARQRAAIERGDRTVPGREADDLLRQSEVFLEIVQDLLGVPRTLVPAQVLAQALAPVTPLATRRAPGQRGG